MLCVAGLGHSRKPVALASIVGALFVPAICSRRGLITRHPSRPARAGESLR